MFLAPGTDVATLGKPVVRLAPPFVSLVLEADEGVPHAAFTVLYSRQAPRIHRFLRDLLGDAALAADAASFGRREAGTRGHISAASSFVTIVSPCESTRCT